MAQQVIADPNTRLVAAIAALLLDQAHAAFIFTPSGVRLYLFDAVRALVNHGLLTKEEADRVLEIGMRAYYKSDGLQRDRLEAVREVLMHG